MSPQPLRLHTPPATDLLPAAQVRKRYAAGQSASGEVFSLVSSPASYKVYMELVVGSSARSSAPSSSTRLPHQKQPMKPTLLAARRHSRAAPGSQPSPRLCPRQQAHADPCRPLLTCRP
jgi:hypothetical protein